MSQNAATEKSLGELHNAIAVRLTEEVQKEELDPRFLQAGIKFLNDNKITCVEHTSNALGELDRQLQKRKTRFGGISDLAKKRAEQEAKDQLAGAVNS